MHYVNYLISKDSTLFCVTLMSSC